MDLCCHVLSLMFSLNRQEDMLIEVLYVDDLVLMSETIEGFRKIQWVEGGFLEQ